jgi:hypothetical protein
VPHEQAALVRDIEIGGPLQPAEALMVTDHIALFTDKSHALFSLDGVRGAAIMGSPARGADDYLSATSADAHAIAIGPGMVFFDWETAGAILDDVKGVTGLSIGRYEVGCQGCLYVTEAATQSVGEYYENGTLLRTLTLAETEPEGVEASRSGVVWVLDARSDRLLGLDAGIAAVDRVMALPPALADRTPTGLAFDGDGYLNVCFRDSPYPCSTSATSDAAVSPPPPGSAIRTARSRP